MPRGGRRGLGPRRGAELGGGGAGVRRGADEARGGDPLPHQAPAQSARRRVRRMSVTGSWLTTRLRCVHGTQHVGQESPICMHVRTLDLFMSEGSMWFMDQKLATLTTAACAQTDL